MVGNNVSHANNKTRRRFLPNLHQHRLWSPSRQAFVKLRISSKGLRMVDRLGVDAVLEQLEKKGKL